MSVERLVLWWNLIFIVPFLLALLYLGVYATTGLVVGEGDADAGADGDLHADADFDPDADVDLHHADEVQVEGGGHVPAYIAALSWLGVGRVPLSILLMVLLMTWGFFGFATSYSMERGMAERSIIPPVSLGAAVVGSVLVTAVASRTIGRWLPTSETYALRRHDLLGAVGEVVLAVDHVCGLVSVRDANGDLFQVQGRVHADHGPIDKGTRVRLIAYNGREKVYYVAGTAAATTAAASVEREAGAKVMDG